MTKGVFVGRASALVEIRSCVEAASNGDARVVWIEGEAGSGKSTLAARVLDELPAAFRILRAQAEELAIDRPFMVTGQLGAGEGDGAFAVGLAMLEVLARTWDMGPVAVVVEDLHWADRESRLALLTAARRLDTDRVVMVVTSRRGGVAADGWDRFCLDERRCQRIVLGGLSQDEVAEMSQRSGLPLTHRAVRRLHAHTGGLPLYVRTLLGDLTSAQLEAPGSELPVPRSLASTILATVAELGVEARDLAGALAVVGEAVPLGVAGRIAGIECPAEALEALLTTGLVTWWPGEAATPVGFAHPLYRSAVYGDVSPTRRQGLHRAAAEVVDTSSAWSHRVAGADGFDDDLADELAQAALREPGSRARGLGATYLLWSSSLTSGRPCSERRLLQAARLLLADGQAVRAAELRPRLEGCSDSPARSLVLGMLAWEQGEVGPAERRLLEAATTAEEDRDEVSAAALGHLGVLYFTEGRAEEAIDAGTRVLAAEPADPDLQRIGWIALAIGEAMARGAPAGLSRLAERLPQPADQVPAGDVDVLATRGTLGFYAGRTTTAIADMRTAIALARRGAVVAQLPRPHFHLCQLLVSAGDWDEALVHAHLALSLVSDEPQVWIEAQVHAALASLSAARGAWEAAEEHLRAAGAAAGAVGTSEAIFTARRAQADLARARHQPRQVVEALAPLAAGGAVPMMTTLAWWPTLIEASVECGDLDAAQCHVVRLEQAAQERELDLRARIAGARAQLQAARGHRDDAAAGFAQALELFGVDDPLLDKAMLHHAFGRLLVAQGRRRPALDHLRVAHGLLDSVGAEPYLQRVDADLACAGVKAPARGSRSRLDLTDREADVVALVSKGMTNREVAAELYISAKAVEYHLGNIFAKLGTTSRRQLRQHLFNPQVVEN